VRQQPTLQKISEGLENCNGYRLEEAEKPPSFSGPSLSIRRRRLTFYDDDIASVSTSTFEPIAFTLIAYFIARALLLAEPRAFWWAGAITGLVFEAKYGAFFWALRLVLTDSRSPDREGRCALAIFGSAR
jgi:hypothetical protein